MVKRGSYEGTEKKGEEGDRRGIKHINAYGPQKLDDITTFRRLYHIFNVIESSASSASSLLSSFTNTSSPESYEEYHSLLYLPKLAQPTHLYEMYSFSVIRLFLTILSLPVDSRISFYPTKFRVASHYGLDWLGLDLNYSHRWKFIIMMVDIILNKLYLCIFTHAMHHLI